MNIRTAERRDLSAMLGIYNYEVKNGTATFDVEPRAGAAGEAWFAAHNTGNHPLLVAEEDGKVLGYASLSPYRDFDARFILDDQASNSLAGYITVAKNAASATTAAQRQLKSYESALRSTELASAKATAAFEASAQQLDAMRAAGEAGTAAYKQLETQNERLRLKVEALGTQTGILTGKARETQAAVEKEAAAIREQADAAEKASKSTKELSDNQKAATSSADTVSSGKRCETACCFLPQYSGAEKSRRPFRQLGFYPRPA